MRAVYFDSAYVFKLQCAERGSSEVRALAAAGHFGMAGRNVIPDPPGPSQ